MRGSMRSTYGASSRKSESNATDPPGTAAEADAHRSSESGGLAAPYAPLRARTVKRSCRSSPLEYELAARVANGASEKIDAERQLATDADTRNAVGLLRAAVEPPVRERGTPEPDRHSQKKTQV